MALLSPLGPQFFQSDGTVAALCKLYTYTTGTTTPATTYSDQAGATPHTNPIVLDSAGRVPSSKHIWLTLGTEYRFRLETSDGSLIWELDDIYGVGDASLLTFDPATSYSSGSLGWGVGLGCVTPRMFGAVGDGLTDDTTPLQDWAASTLPHALDEGTNYLLTGSLSLPNVIAGRGAKITCSATGVITSTGTLTQIADLSVSPSAGDQTLTFGSAHGLSRDDVIIIYNPTNGSYSGARNEYRAGEFCRAALIPSSTTLDLTQPLHAGYTAANVDVYKMTRKEVNWSDLTIVGPDVTVPGFKLSLATRVALRNVFVSFANYLGAYIDRCYEGTIIGGGAMVPKTGTADCFGLFFGNSQNFTVHGGTWYALRNAVDHGGDDVLCCVPTRDITYNGSRIWNDVGVSAAAANSHGNSENITYSAGTIIEGGAAFDGRNIEFDACTISRGALGLGGLIIGGSECIGGRYVVRDCKLIGGPAYANGFIRLYNGANAQEAFTVIVEDNAVTLGSCDTYVRIDTAVATYKANASVDGADFVDGASSLTNVLRMVGTGSGGTGDYAIVDRIKNGPASGCSLFVEASSMAVARVKLQRQTGKVNVTPVSGQPNAATTVTMRYSYGSRVPAIQLTAKTGTVNSQAIATYYTSESATGFGANFRVADDANAGVTSPDVEISWATEVAEI